MFKINYIKIGARIREFMKLENITQEDLARRMKLDQSQVSKSINGKQSNLNILWWILTRPDYQKYWKLLILGEKD